MPGENEGEEKRVDLISCVFCPFREDDVCMAYQSPLDDNSKKPGYCRYKAIIIGKSESAHA